MANAPSVANAPPAALDPQALAQDALELAEKFILQACQSNVAAVTLGAAHIMRAGGKRLRPLVLILSHRACARPGAGCAGEPERAARLAAAVELIHTATLVHDDVVDEADTRRGQYSVNIFFGNEASVLMGDYLVCRALRMIADEPDADLMRSICDVIVSMCEAEVLQITYRGDLDNTFENYLRVIRNKTACLFGFTALAGARSGGASAAAAEQFRSFGTSLGIAFQVVDDILDLQGVRQEIGKPTGSDLREGKFTYPVLHALHTLEGAPRKRLAELLSDPPALTDEQMRAVVEIVEEAGGIHAAYDFAGKHAHRALEAIEETPHTPALDALRLVTRQVVDRRA